MKKVVIQGFLLVAFFLGGWLLLLQVDWMTLFNVNQTVDKTEERLGELLWQVFHRAEPEIDQAFVVRSIDSIANKICTENRIERASIRIHILSNDEVNAFAFPNGHLIVYTGLILETENQDALCGVICHELAHIELDHVMKKVVREVGLSMVVTMTTGSGGSELLAKVAKVLSSSAYDKKLEKEADLKAVEYLKKTNIDPEPFANFLFRLSDKETEEARYLVWIRSHPELKERAKYILETRRTDTAGYCSILSESTWAGLLEQIKRNATSSP